MRGESAVWGFGPQYCGNGCGGHLPATRRLPTLQDETDTPVEHVMIRRLLAPCLLGLAVATAAMTDARAARVAETDEFLTGEISVERRIRLPQGGASARMHVDLAITNTGAEDLILRAPADCAVHNWIIALPNNDPVLYGVEPDCKGETVETVIEAGGTLKGGNSIMLRSNDLAVGQRYYLIYEYWGVRMRTPFQIFEDD